MKCPECERLGLKSSVYPENSSAVTEMCVYEFWDEDGRGHRHDPNHTGGGFRCSNKHYFSYSRLRPCGNCNYGNHGIPVVYLIKDGQREKLGDKELILFLKSAGIVDPVDLNSMELAANG